MPGKTQIPEVWILDTALETRVKSIRLATGWKSLESWMKNLLAVLQHPTGKPGLGGNVLFCVLLLTEGPL